MGIIYRPECPYSDKSGFIEKSDYYLWLSFRSGDKRMMKGNVPVKIRYICDGMEPTRHMCLPLGSAPVDSKSKFRKITKQNKCIEVGNEEKYLLKERKPVKLDKRQRRNDIKRAIWELKNGRDIKTEVLQAATS